MSVDALGRKTYSILLGGGGMQRYLHCSENTAGKAHDSENTPVFIEVCHQKLLVSPAFILLACLNRVDKSFSMYMARKVLKALPWSLHEP